MILVTPGTHATTLLRMRVLRHSVRGLAMLAVVVGGLLLVAQIAGLLRPAAARGSSGEIAGYDQPVLPPAAVSALLTEDVADPGVEWLEHAHSVVGDGLAHGLVLLRPEQSWVLWLGSRITGYQLMATQDPQVIIRARRGFCSQTAAVLQAAARNAGVPSRFLDFDGHVALEVQVDGKWFVADTDYDVLYPFDVEALADPASKPTVERLLAQRGFDAETIDVYLDIVQDEPARRHEIDMPHEPLAAKWERTGVMLSWVLPVLAVVFGLLLLKLVRTRPSRSPGE